MLQMPTFLLLGLFLSTIAPLADAWEQDELIFPEAPGPHQRNNHGFNASIVGHEWSIEEKRRYLRHGDKMKMKRIRRKDNGAQATEEPTPVPVEEVLPTLKSEFVFTLRSNEGTEAPTPVPVEEVPPTIRSEFRISRPERARNDDNES